MVLIKTIIFTIFIPGTVTILVPYWLLSAASTPIQPGPFRYFGMLPLLIGVAIYCWCAWDFAFAGKGTPAPFDLVAAELVRVCRRGGQIAMANWTPEGFVGQMFKTTGKHVPPPPSMPSPLKWGDEETVRERLREGIADLQLKRQMCQFKFPFPAAEVVETFRMYYGPTQRAFGSLDTDAQAALRTDLERLWAEHNQATDGTTLVEGEYLEVVATKG